MKYSCRSKYLMDKMNEELKQNGYKTKCYYPGYFASLVSKKESNSREHKGNKLITSRGRTF